MKVFGYLPEFHYTKSSGEKAAYADKGILIDDRAKAVLPFRKAGGKAILFVGSKEEALKEIRKLHKRKGTIAVPFLFMVCNPQRSGSHPE